MADDPVVVHITKHEPEPLSVSQHTCEKHTGITPKRFLDLVARGELPHRRAGHDRIVLLEDVKTWLKARPVKKPPAPKPVDSLEALMARGGAKKAG